MSTRKWPDDFKPEMNATMKLWRERLAANPAITMDGLLACNKVPGMYVYGAVSVEHKSVEGGDDPFMTNTAAQKIQAVFDRMFEQTLSEDRVWTGEEWRNAVTPLAETDAPGLRFVLARADASWTNDQWFEAVREQHDLLVKNG